MAGASSPPAGSGWGRGREITGDLLDELEKDPQFVQATRSSATDPEAVSC